jgi:hypothetical protein
MNQPSPPAVFTGRCRSRRCGGYVVYARLNWVHERLLAHAVRHHPGHRPVLPPIKGGLEVVA